MNLKLFDFFKKKEVIKHDNEVVLKMIYDRFNLGYNEGYFNPSTWLRKGNLMVPYETSNDSIITIFAGLSVKFDIKAQIYMLSIPPKFNNSFYNGTIDLIQKHYDIIEVKPYDFMMNRYTATIKFIQKSI